MSEPSTDPNPHSFLEGAKSYHRTAAIAFQYDGGMTRETFPAFYLLTGFGLELGMKSLLLANGMPAPEVKRLGHDLDEAFRLCKDRQAWRVLPHHKLATVVRDVNRHHNRPYTLRYLPARVRIAMPPPSETLVALDHLIQEVEWQARLIPDAGTA